MSVPDLVESISGNLCADCDGSARVDKAQFLVTSTVQLQLLLRKPQEPTCTRLSITQPRDEGLVATGSSFPLKIT